MVLLMQKTLQLVFDPISSLPYSFQLASMDTNMSLLIKKQVSALCLRSDNSMSPKCDMEWWDNFFGSVTDSPNSLPEIEAFKLPKISFATNKISFRDSSI